MSEILTMPADALKYNVKMNPFAEISKEPLFTSKGDQSKAYSIRIKNDDDVFEEIGTVKEGYLVMENQELSDLANEVADESGLQWKEDRIFFNGKHYTYGITTDSVLADAAVGDAMGLGLLFQNSYDGKLKTKVQAYVSRLVCTNGMIAPMFFDTLTFKHNQGSIEWKDQIKESLEYIKYAEGNLMSFAAMCQKMNETPISLNELSNIRRNYLDQRIPAALWGRLIDRYLTHERTESESVWGFVNACTNVTWHENTDSQQYLGHNKFIMQQMLQWTSAETDTKININDLKFQ